jgi:hypothetical protein
MKLQREKKAMMVAMSIIKQAKHSPARTPGVCDMPSHTAAEATLQRQLEQDDAGEANN